MELSLLYYVASSGVTPYFDVWVLDYIEFSAVLDLAVLCLAACFPAELGFGAVALPSCRALRFWLLAQDKTLKGKVLPFLPFKIFYFERNYP